MTSNRSFELTALALVLVVVVAAVAPAAAVTVDESDVPAEAEAGEQISATFYLTDLYQEPNWDPWTLEGETDMTNVTWTVTYVDAGGSEFDTVTHDGAEFAQSGISADEDIIELRVEVTGDVPEPEEYTYPEEETFVVADLRQVSGEDGAHDELGTWEAHHFTTGSEEPEPEPGTQDVREALDSAQAAIDTAEEAGGDTGEAETSLQSAISSYENGNFENAISQAERAESEANEAENQAERNDLLLIGGGVVVLVALLGGGFWWWRQQQDDYDKLG